MDFLKPLTPSQRRSRIFKDLYEYWKSSGIAHWSASGTSVNYLATRALEDSVSFDIKMRYDDGAPLLAITRVP